MKWYNKKFSELIDQFCVKRHTIYVYFWCLTSDYLLWDLRNWKQLLCTSNILKKQYRNHTNSEIIIYFLFVTSYWFVREPNTFGCIMQHASRTFCHIANSVFVVVNMYQLEVQSNQLPSTPQAAYMLFP